jgi:DNA-binding response OmpR family regulator
MRYADHIVIDERERAAAWQDGRAALELILRGPYEPQTLLSLLGEFDVRTSLTGAGQCVVLTASAENYRTALAEVLSRTAAPLVLVLSNADPAHFADALEAGADDVIGGGCQPRELIARVRNALRRAGRPPGNVLRIADLEIVPEQRIVRRGTREVQLSKTECALLLSVARREGRVVASDTLSEEVWGKPTSRASLHTYVSYLRRKVDLPSRRSIVQTVRGVGYAINR